MMDAREKLKMLIRQYGGTQKVFASIIGTTQPTIANWLAQNQIPDGGVAKICSALPDVSFEWLTGLEDMPRTGYQEEGVRHNGDSMPVGAAYYSRMPASAGQLEMGDEDVTTERIAIPGMQVDAYFPVVGNSMDPTIQSGDIVGIRKVETMSRIRPNDIYLVFTRDNERMLKRIKGVNSDSETLTLYSDNPNYEPFEVLKEQVSAVYRAVVLIRTLE